MTDITPLIPEGKQVIDSYGEGGFTVSGKRYEGSLLILPDKVTAWAVTKSEELSAKVFQEFFVELGPDGLAEIEILLLGSGKTLVQPDRFFKVAFHEHNIAVEAMDTGAACRTYNVLLAEERKVAAALIAVI